MNNADKLKEAMEPGRVYRRQDLEDLSTAVDRELKALVSSNKIRKLSGGLYCRPKLSQWGALPPDDRELVRAFLKTDDFRLTSFNDFNVLGLGLTQVYGVYVVYNHKRVGTFTLGSKEFQFRRVPAYPPGQVPEPEYLLVDMLNNLRRLPDNVELVLKNLKKEVQRFERAKVLACLERYGNPAAKRLLREAYA